MEISTTGYATLFAVQLLHRYFLDVGDQPFEEIDQDLKEGKATPLLAARRAYDVAQFARIVPDPATETALRNGRMLFKPGPDGFRVAVAVDLEKDEGYLQIPLPDKLTLRFCLYLTDPHFTTYTNIGQENWRRCQKEEGMFVWSNQPGKGILNEDGLPLDLWAGVGQFSSTEDLATKPFVVLEITHSRHGDFPQFSEKRTIRRHEMDVEVDIPRAIRYQVVIENRWVAWKTREDYVSERGSDLLQQRRKRKGDQGFWKDFPLFPLVSSGFLKVQDVRNTGENFLHNPTPNTTHFLPEANEYMALIP